MPCCLLFWGFVAFLVPDVDETEFSEWISSVFERAHNMKKHVGADYGA